MTHQRFVNEAPTTRHTNVTTTPICSCRGICNIRRSLLTCQWHVSLVRCLAVRRRKYYRHIAVALQQVVFREQGWRYHDTHRPATSLTAITQTPPRQTSPATALHPRTHVPLMARLPFVGNTTGRLDQHAEPVTDVRPKRAVKGARQAPLTARDSAPGIAPAAGDRRDDTAAVSRCCRTKKCWSRWQQRSMP